MKLIQRYGVIFALIALFVAFSAYQPSLFLTQGNLLTVITSQSSVLLLAIAVTIPLRAGEFDLSIGAIMVVSSLETGILFRDHHASIPVLIVVALAIGAVAGLVNALLVVGLKINGFIATLGTSSVLGGIGYGISNSAVVGPLDGSITSFARDSVGSIPAAVFWGWGIAIVLWVVFERTVLGRYWLFAGGNAEAARLAGVRTQAVKFLSFVVSGAICGFAGLLLTGTIGSSDPSTSGGYLLGPFAAAFVGTAVLQEGRFNIIGTVIGTYLISVADIGLELFGAPTWFGQVFSGLILIVALAIAKLGGTSAPARMLRRTVKSRSDPESGAGVGGADLTAPTHKPTSRGAPV